jgi:hypothetical protein
MEPETSAPKFGSERAPQEHAPEHSQQPTPERGLLETGAEQSEQAAEVTSHLTDNSGTPSLVVPTVIVGDDGVTTDSVVIGSPAIAADEDLIEKEWVDRAKKIVADTRDDPYQQENAVSALQKDYQKKRYGRELGEAN